MVVSALVVLLHSEPDRRVRALAELARDPRLVLGAVVRDRLPVVAEADSARGGVELCDRIAEVDGVVRVDVVAIDFQDDP